MAGKKPATKAAKRGARAVQPGFDPTTASPSLPIGWQVVPPSGAPGFTVAGPTADERGWAMWAHLAAFLGLIVSLGNVLGPLVVWLIKRRESAFIDFHGRAAVNFQILVSVLGAVLSGILVLALFAASPEPKNLGALLETVWAWVPFFFFYLAFLVVSYVFVAIAATRAARGEPYRYPLSVSIIR